VFTSARPTATFEYLNHVIGAC